MAAVSVDHTTPTLPHTTTSPPPTPASSTGGDTKLAQKGGGGGGAPDEEGGGGGGGGGGGKEKMNVKVRAARVLRGTFARLSPSLLTSLVGYPGPTSDVGQGDIGGGGREAKLGVLKLRRGSLWATVCLFPALYPPLPPFFSGCCCCT